LSVGLSILFAAAKRTEKTEFVLNKSFKKKLKLPQTTLPLTFAVEMLMKIKENL
jgi:hypothetical protein